MSNENDPKSKPKPSKDATKRSHAADLRAATKLVVAATRSITDAVQDMHVTIAGGPPLIGSPLARPTRAITQLVYEPIRRIAALVGDGLDAAFAELEPLVGESTPGPEREAAVAALNGVLGDYLVENGNPLAIRMALRHEGRVLELDRDSLRAAYPEASSKVLVLVHGSSMSDRQWRRSGHDHGASLASELGFSAVYLHYNSGLHVSQNGRAFADLLEKLTIEWPVEVTELDIIGHSMGGLVARSACEVATVAGLSWRSKLRRIAFLGTPHHGSPLERGGNWIDVLLGMTSYSAPIGRLARIRSAGVTDLRFGNVTDAHWEGRDRFEPSGDARQELALPVGVECFTVAATTASELTTNAPGDGLVPLKSALGEHEKGHLTLAFPEAHRFVVTGTDHLALLSSSEVYERLRLWFGGTLPEPAKETITGG